MVVAKLNAAFYTVVSTEEKRKDQRVSNSPDVAPLITKADVADLRFAGLSCVALSTDNLLHCESINEVVGFFLFLKGVR